ncbi:Bcr/CflA family efflux MFS transporter [Amycolatopsis lurida]
MSASVRRSAVFTLAAIVGLMPFAIDMFLSSLPAISQEFATPVWVNQLTLTGYLLVLGAGQLIAGPITDALGRRRPLLVGIVLFTVAAVIAAAAPTIEVLVGARLLQGFGGAIAVVVANSSVRDRAQGKDATRLYAVLLTVMALAPVIAPAVGGFIDLRFGWRMVFAALAILGVLVLLCALAFLPESLSVSGCTPFAAVNVVSGYGKLLRTRAFSAPLAALGATFMLLFAYIGGASYVYQQVYGLNPAAFGAVFGATGLALIGGAFVANRQPAGFATATLAVAGIITMIVGSVMALAAVLTGLPFWTVALGMAVILFGLGTCEPTLMSMCMNVVDEGTGAAAAVTGAAQYVLGAAATVIAGVLAVAVPSTWAAILVACAALALIFALRSGRMEKHAPSAPVPELTG